MAKKEFKAESKRLLELMIHSIYTHKEIFLRELLSNASDAIDKLSYRSLTDEGVGLSRGDFAITVTPDAEKRTLTVSDNGIGMSREELEENLGVIANSGTFRFRQELNPEKAGDTDVIGQFGVGFYSAFMVADHITVISKKYGEEQAYRWESSGADGYTVDPCENETVGTDIILHLRDDGDEPDEYSQYLREGTLARLVKKYSDYIRFPIRMEMTHSRRKEGSPDDKPEFEDVREWETVNSMVPLWQRKKSDVKREEYDKFYQERFGDMTPPQSVVTVSAEGAVTYQALLFIPSQAPGLYYTEDYEPGLQLYSSGVMIMDRCADLLPDYLSFVRGVVDSPDLSLNISRELLQHDRQLKIISANLNNYGAQKDKLQDLLLFYSSTEKKLVTLGEYVSRMPESQKYIYFAAGESIEAIDHMPQTEVLKDSSTEILYFTDKTDEFIADMFRTYQEKEFRSALDDEPETTGEEKKEPDEAAQPALDFIRETLGAKVDGVKASTRLKTHPVCLTCGEGLTFEMEKYFTAVQPDLGLKAKRILEVNTNHPAFAALENARENDPEKAKKYAEILYQQACLIAGLPIENPSDYTDLLCSLW